MKLRHNSTIVEFREPLGALRAGDSVKLSLSAEQEWEEEDLGYEVALLLGGGPDGSWKEYIMEAECGGEDDENGVRVIWSCETNAPEQAGVYWYYFRIRKDDVLYFFGASRNRNAGEGEPITGIPSCYQLTVYERDFETPEWFRNSTMYQIFPDRYCRGREENLTNGIQYHRSMGRKVHEHLNWEEIPYYQPLDGDEYYYPGDFFGGDLEGIRQNLDELKEMGITCLYLNPIVEADSNHRYNTADYRRVDPILGTEEDFVRLCKEAEERGIRVLLDGVYSHTGDDSIYFNKKGNYPEPGAFQRENSLYDSWYSFDPDGVHYKSWWGFEAMPEVNEFDPVWQDMVVTGEDSVFHFWQDRGAAGFRLDVADELPDEVIELMRQAVKRESKDNVLLGEVWEDATIKESYGKKRTYALGKGLDSVMNYPFRNMTIAWLTGWQHSREIANFLNAQKANYPQPMYGALMNLISSHDVPRIRTVLAAGTEGKGMSREDQAGFVLDHKSERKGAKLSRLAMGLQFMIPGVPSVYYGDEYGMNGFSDPFNRGTLEKKDVDLADFVKRLSLLRKEEPTLRTGGMSAMSLGERGLAVLRCMEDGTEQGSCILAVFNPTRIEQEFQIPLSELKEGLTREERKIVENRWKADNPGRIQILFTAEIKGETEATCQIQDELTVCLGPTDMVVLRL